MVNAQPFKGLALRLKKHRWISLLVVLVVVVGGFLIYRSYSAHADREKFVQARATIGTIYADIVAKVGQPDNYRRTNDCSRPSQEFTQGPLSCSVGTDFIYGVTDETQANTMLKSIQAVIASRPDLFTQAKAPSNGITDTLVVNTYYHSAEDNYKSGSSDIDCSIKYIYDTPREIDLSIDSPSKKPLQINIGCSDWAKSQYYPLEN